MSPTTGSAVVTLPSETEILITRRFDAPRAVVYQVFTDPELIKRWWAGRQGTVTSAEVDLRVGGMWRYVMTTNSGYEIAFHGEYHEVVPDERLVCTEIFEGMPDEDDTSPPTLNSYTFTESGGRTTLELLTTAPDRAVRDAIMESGMETGVHDGYDIAEQIAIELTDGS
ncbi:SRPBCC family protein [Georgenia deserti]|uniref:SRPBCC family protein n=1 Tax=Georgenia deserti TaxID=2093781 RepID=A0ABW4L5I0_9MICO